MFSNLLYFLNKSSNNSKNNNNDVINKNNENHVLVNFQHILLNKIISYLDPIDRIFFTLVCKRWYNERDNLILFDSDKLMLKRDYINEFGIKVVYHLKSYEKSIKNSINGKSEILLHYCDDNSYKSYIYDYKPHDQSTLEIILKDNHSKINKCIYTSHSSDILRNVMNFENLTSLTLTRNLNLKEGILNSPKLKELILYQQVEILEAGDLPPQLERLTFVMRELALIVSADIFPETLRYLKLDCFCIVQSLPPKLEEMSITNTTNDLIPSTQNISGFYSFNVDLSQNTSIKVFRTYMYHDPALPSIPVMQLPSSITDLSIYLYSSLSEVEMEMEEDIPIPVTIDPFIHSNVETLCISFPFEAGCNIANWFLPTSSSANQSQHKLKHLEIQSNSLKLTKGSIPKGVETLNLSTCYDMEISKDSIPDTVKSLTLPRRVPGSSIHTDKFPRGLETLNLHTFSGKLNGKIPSTVKHIKFATAYMKHHTLSQLIPDTVHSITITHNFQEYNLKRLESKYFMLVNTTENKYDLSISGIITLEHIANYFNIKLK